MLDVSYSVKTFRTQLMKGSGTRNAIFILKMLCERAIQVQEDLYITFLDYKKAFDKVKDKELLKMLQDIGIDNKDLRVVGDLYLNQTAAIHLPDNTLDEWVRVVRGVRQGCVISPDFFILYREICLRLI